MMISEDFCKNVAHTLGIEASLLIDFEPDFSLQKRLSLAMARRYQALPLFDQGRHFTVALADPFDAEAIDALEFVLDSKVEQVVAPPARVKELLSLYSGEEKYFSPIQVEALSTANVSGNDESPVIRYVDQLLDHAITVQASDLHFEPLEKECLIRYRVDGTLHEWPAVPRALALAVISRIKMMAHLDITEQRLPQDGRLEKKSVTAGVAFRVATLPTQFGESLVLRLLDRHAMCLSLPTLQLSPSMQEELLKIIHEPHGLFIVTGPTGSGKTTTLYSCLHEINHESLKLLTVEDPVEYQMEGVLQIPINAAIGLNFPRVLRSLLRHDPDVIMVGETRDAVTAQMAMQASLTGHRVFTTLHTSDAAGAVARLIDMGAEPMILATTLSGILAQRLLRKICPCCRVAYRPEKKLLAQLEISTQEDETFFYRGGGCSACDETGYQGRAAIFELLVMNDELRAMINAGASHGLLREKAIEQGMISLRSEGLRLLREGITTADEVLSHC